MPVMNSQAHLCLNVKFSSILKPGPFSYLNLIFVILFYTLCVCLFQCVCVRVCSSIDLFIEIRRPPLLNLSRVLFILYVVLHSLLNSAWTVHPEKLSPQMSSLFPHLFIYLFFLYFHFNWTNHYIRKATGRK